ncbi:MAG TPA: winged helix-turn-helix domain-containing protein [Thermoanaerobaculia bacterium]|nr:winged helix-turn-helix domain-containing protein [Thermoanaerobaculia bacterium]
MVITEPTAGPLRDTQELPAADALVFDDFELRLDSWELLRSGVPVKLQQQPARVLALLAQRAGVAVSREEIRRAVWGEESHLDFDLALNYCVRQIRRALEDSAENPRYLATLPRIGYRFIAPVEVRRPETDVVAATPAPSKPLVPSTRTGASSLQISVATALVLLLAIVGLIALRAREARSAAAVRSAAPPIPAEATRAYLEGQYFASRAETRKARDSFQRATALAPRFAPAWASLANVLLEDQGPAREREPMVEAAERRALALDPALALAHLDRAERLFRYEYAWGEAEKEYRRALELDPQDGEAHYEYSLMLAARGRIDEALEQVDQARYLEPDRQLARARYPWIYYLARRYDEAIDQARQQIELAPGKTSETAREQPELFWAFRTLTLAALAKGDRTTALEAAHAEARWLGDPEPASLEEHWRYKESNFARHGTPRPWFRVVPAIELGDRERALDLLLEQCRERSDSMLGFLRVDPVYDSLRGLPRFRELLRCANQADELG